MPDSGDRGAIRGRDALWALALLLFGFAITLPFSGPEIRSTPDGLYYEAQKRELQGESAQAARDGVFSSALAEPLVREELSLEPELRRVSNPEWVDYSAQFYRRRWSVPVLAAALDPLFGDRALEQASLIGWALIAPLVFLLLRRRFDPPLSAVVAAFCAVLPPLWAYGHWPLTDSWGIALLIGALLALLLVRDVGNRWLPVWFVLVLALSFTRDLSVIALVAAGWLALRERDQRLAVATGGGLLAAATAPLLFAAPLRENLAYAFNDYRIPADTSWGTILGDYPSHLWSLLTENVQYPLDSPYPVVVTAVIGLVVIGALLALITTRHGDDPLVRLARAAGVAGVLTILISVNYTGLRLELVFVPAIAVGTALFAELVLERSRRRGRASPA